MFPQLPYPEIMQGQGLSDERGGGKGTFGGHGALENKTSSWRSGLGLRLKQGPGQTSQLSLSFPNLGPPRAASRGLGLRLEGPQHSAKSKMPGSSHSITRFLSCSQRGIQQTFLPAKLLRLPSPAASSPSLPPPPRRLGARPASNTSQVSPWQAGGCDSCPCSILGRD